MEPFIRKINKRGDSIYFILIDFLLWGPYVTLLRNHF